MLKKKLKSRAQIFTWDLIVSLSLFLITLGLLLYLWNSALWNFSYSKEMYEISWLANTIAEQLIRTSGFPKNWHVSSEAIVIGLTYSDEFNHSKDRILDFDKFLHLLNLTNENYTIVRNRLLATGKYDFYIEVNCLIQEENCFENIKVETISDAIINCSNNANFTIVNSTATLKGEPRCIFGRYATPSSSVMMAVEKRTATFHSNLNSTMEITVVVWAGLPAQIPLIPVMTTTTTLPTGSLICGVFNKGSCIGGVNNYARIFSMFQSTNSHVGILESYGFKDLCCKITNGELNSYNTPSNCLDGDACILSLLYAENSHAEGCTYGNYQNKICINISLGNIDCNLISGTSCPEGQYEVASLYNTVDSHVGGAGDYNNKICCSVTIVESTTTVTSTTTTETTITATTTTTTTTIKTLECSIRGTCLLTETCFFTMFSTSGGHSATCTAPLAYENKVCCLIAGCSSAITCTILNSPNICSGNFKPVINLYAETNAHAQSPEINTYAKRICCDTSACGGALLSCSVRANSCNSDETCIASMYSTDNSHIGGCSAFTQKLCCKLV